MGEEYNIYCDESCHLEHDDQPIMLFGAIWCPSAGVKNNLSALRQIKEKNHARGELKWTKISPSRESFFLEIIVYFFRTAGLNYRCLIVDGKKHLDHSYFNQGDHDSFYYKMYFYLLRNILSPDNKYSIYLDIKDTRSQMKIDRLRDILCSSFGDFQREMIKRIQHVRSKEVELLQVADLLTGAISYSNRRLKSSSSKATVVRTIQRYSGLTLQNSTPPWEEKFNLFHFSPRLRKP